MPRDAVQSQIPELATARLVYVCDADPGITRQRAGMGFIYRGPDGRIIRDAAILDRIRTLAVPPAYTQVWICTLPHGHLQATGVDRRGRKQYRYHRRWREVRDEAKFSRLAAFGRALPGLRARCDADLAAPGLSKRKVVAAVVRLLETTLARVGNEAYAAANGSFGLTTLRKRHADVTGTRIVLEFRAKSGRLHRVGLRNRRLARLVRTCQDLPGHRLFQYVDDDGERHPISSDDVNAYLQDATGEAFTAKDFRTWAGTLLAAAALAARPLPTPRAAADRVVTACVGDVARALGNTPAVCRKAYVHPAVIEAWHDGALDPKLGLIDLDPAARERKLLAFINSRS
ncbi:DNA topoisomerase IB [Vineibacter terrae]|uniref:DNA topoisomerase IB n=1 Tax=Vineibacter terrae TaxID=2586908 RepID=UPI002E337D15|nr:DNA topoisomerase IB [Vineibacter terrae]HEX2890436.1 DNA topoisomerase IB [Vineibacter terrae]